MLEGFPLYFWEFLILNLPLYRLLMANYNFPQGISSNRVSGQPYMMLTSYESKNAIESTGQTGFGANVKYNPAKIMSSIALYIPPNALTTAFTSTYGDVAGATATKAVMGSAMKNNLIDIIGAGLKGTGVSLVEKAADQLDKGTGMLAAQGIAVNNHLALSYKGPTQFRQHQFSFTFFPKNNGEANIIQGIIKDLENGMLPRMKGGDFSKIKGRTLSAPFFQSPRHWTIEFFKKTGEKNNYLFQIGKSVITAMTVNHDQQSTVSLHIEDESPVQTTLALTFQEIELRVSSDETIEGDTTLTSSTPQTDSNPLRARNRFKNIG
jgi:hypothetical protein